MRSGAIISARRRLPEDDSNRPGSAPDPVIPSAATMLRCTRLILHRSKSLPYTIPLDGNGKVRCSISRISPGRRSGSATPRRSRSISATSISATSTFSCPRASTPTEATSSARPCATRSPATATSTRQSVARKGVELGLRRYDRAELEAARASGIRLDIRVLGLASIAPDVTPGTGPRRHRVDRGHGKPAGDPGREGGPRRPPSLTISRNRVPDLAWFDPSSSRKANPMTDPSNRMQDRLADMMEATRLTAAGRLQDATDLLQRGFAGAPGRSTADHGAPAPQPHTIDLVAERVETGPATDRSGASASQLRRIRALDQPGPSGHGRGRGGAPRRDPPREAAQGRGDGDAGHRPGARRPRQGRSRRGRRPSGLAGNLGTLVSGLAGGLGPSGFNQARAPLTGGRQLHGAQLRQRGRARGTTSCSSPATPVPEPAPGGDAARLHPVAGRFRRRHRHERAGRGARASSWPTRPRRGRANGQRCWNWFQPGDQGRDSGEAGIIAGLTRAIIAEHRDRPGPGLHRRPVGGRRGGGEHRPGLSRPLRGGGHPFRPRGGLRPRRLDRPHGDAPRPRGRRRLRGRRGAGAHHRVPRRERRHREPAQRRAGAGPGRHRRADARGGGGGEPGRPALHPHPLRRRGRPGRGGGLDRARPRPCLVRRQPGRAATPIRAGPTRRGRCSTSSGPIPSAAGRA